MSITISNKPAGLTDLNATPAAATPASQPASTGSPSAVSASQDKAFNDIKGLPQDPRTGVSGDGVMAVGQPKVVSPEVQALVKKILDEQHKATLKALEDASK